MNQWSKRVLVRMMFHTSIGGRMDEVPTEIHKDIETEVRTTRWLTPNDSPIVRIEMATLLTLVVWTYHIEEIMMVTIMVKPIVYTQLK
jgi:hypothetical protein